MHRSYFTRGFFVGMILLVGCDRKSEDTVMSKTSDNTLFTKMEAEKTGLSFSNTIVENENQNVLLYEYFYNGGGVAVADFNNDGKEDIFITANQQSCKLYLNKSAWHFEDVTDKAGVSGRVSDWKTGAVAVDVNADGWMDIYLCYSGPLPKEHRVNQLFINKGVDPSGVPMFMDEAASYGLDNPGFTTHAAFFDYDHDGDLDVILINHSPRRPDNLTPLLIADMIRKTSEIKGVRLFRNDGDKFTDATLQSGLFNSELNFGLGIAIADINGDGWQDVYLSNDYLVPDYLYINNANGTFTDHAGKMLRHMPQFSMGNAVGDINNDALPDILTLDMLPEDNRRQKLLFAPDNYEVFDLYQQLGFHAQFMRNMLQLNNGDGTFSEIGQLAGVSNTDWSWAPLLVDLDNDGWKDLYVTNGYLRDFTNMDFIKYITKYFKDNAAHVKKEDMINVVEQMPSSNVKDYVFQNNGGATFTNRNSEWGITDESNGNGAVFSDLDNDGDYDLVVNTINGIMTVYRNDASRYNQNRSLSIELKGEGKNTKGAGAKILVWIDGKMQLYEQNPSVGFQSSVSQKIIVGCANHSTIDSMRVIWPLGKEQLLVNVPTEKELVLREADAIAASKKALPVKQKPLFKEATTQIDFKHHENRVNDFKRQPLMTGTLSYTGPCITLADVSGDKKADLYIGGAAGQPGEVFVKSKNGYVKSNQPALIADAKSEDTDALFFDADNDGDVDLYVCSGGYDLFVPDDVNLQDRLYLNNGNGIFSKNIDALPVMHVSSSCVRAADVNHDGYLDLFVGGRVIPGRYPEVPRSYLLINDGKGNFKDSTSGINRALEYPGLVTDAAWADMNSDGWPDLVTAGEWMPIQVWINDKGKLIDKTVEYFQKEYNGWWNKIEVTDVNNDSHPDIIAGNLGLNSQCRASDKQPAELYFKDFDDNGSVDPILCFYIQGKRYPYVSRDELLEQLAFMRKRFKDYESYSNVDMDNVFTADELKGATHWKANTFETKVFVSNSDGKLMETELPMEVQYSPVHAIAVHDFNEDGKVDLLLAGNEKHGRLRFGWYDANYGVLLLQEDTGKFRYVCQYQSGLSLTGDIRSMMIDESKLFIGVNGGSVLVYSF